MTAKAEGIELDRPVLQVARDLLGNYIVREDPRGVRRVRIVETEAYAEDDPASHSYNGPTPRSRVMFGPAGYWYVYQCYGIHWMLNVVTGPEDTGEAVLLRAGEPVEGKEIMEQERDLEGLQITNGPGKLAQALSVDERFDSKSVSGGQLVLEAGPTPERIYESPRVGIREGEDRYWRYFVDNDYVSDVSQNDLSRRRD